MKKAEWWVAIPGFLMCFVFACLQFLLSYWNGSYSIYMLSWFYFGASGIWFLVFLHNRQRRLALEEELEESLLPSSQENSLFDEQQIDPFSARSKLEFFEKWLVPSFTTAFSIAFFTIGLFTFLQYRSAGRLPLITNGGLSAAFLTTFAFASLLLSMYALGMAKEKEWRLLRAGASFLFVGAALCFLTAIFVIMTEIKYVMLENYLAGVIPFVLILTGIELALNLLLDIYRPRVKGQETHPPYDSRLLNMCTGSKGFLTTVAHALDYQFGFKISETWFYQFMEKAIAPLILFQLCTLYLLSCVFVVHPWEQGVLERFGVPQEKVLQPGLHFKLPWPFETSHRYSVNRLEMVQVGSVVKYENKEVEGRKRDRGALFAKDHGHEEYLFLLGHEMDKEQSKDVVPVNLLAVGLNIQFRIKNVFEYMYRHSEPKDLLEGLSYREATKFFASSSLEEVLGSGRLETGQILQQEIQKRAEEYHLGIEVQLVTLRDIHPPIPTGEAFESVISAMEEKETIELKAEKLKVATEPIAKAEAKAIVIEAQSYFLEKQKLTEAESKAFESYLKSFNIGKGLYLTRKFLKILESKLPGKRLYISNLPQNGKDTVYFNLEDPFSTGFTQLDLTDDEEKEQENE